MSSRKRKAWTVTDKVNTVERVNKGKSESQAKVLRNLGVSESTLLGWLKDKEKLCEFLHTVDESDGLNRKRAYLANNESLDAALYKCFVQQHM